MLTSAPKSGFIPCMASREPPRKSNEEPDPDAPPMPLRPVTTKVGESPDNLKAREDAYKKRHSRTPGPDDK